MAAGILTGGEGRNRLKPTAITLEIIDKSPNRIKLFAKVRSLLVNYPFTIRFGVRDIGIRDT